MLMPVLIGFLVAVFFLVACGKKKPPEPPPPPSPPKAASYPTSQRVVLPKGKGGYFVGDGGFPVLYWSFPSDADYTVVYLDGKPVARVEGYTYLYPKKVKEKKVFRMVGYKNGKPVGEVFIGVLP